ncbi:undecaprenyldiphospho-muramoylpentapeptide beta-N-acetylglucosaminyltransferase [Reichenbachiella agariperforans]|uniref:UDP-N-acetylglucosamine--N-acetylmuramyl-(pentapeptide) pyrophosphoryl-undecaprenol N-acetylglucosamine transferase n=2 Tax=Reichenbachiellaceae TaxID=2762302 RepID=A0A1M6LJV4_REIAG|nr:undecaprenyldiphospho-muramoylpentapeptide beta-N-acetylglucosaminyltransferase [Reichenbachiella agariperforans]RJE75386.1 undecaprenyldiphospho-muramoylpentapeptide beta-N-acetylglucosaminyltransferase [Reichenbachiella sp. MSK19-1]SHJ71425.1 UDP-N-acetylglucosamine-N-acetylmuramylpentapeptide N-acetylglucosamine transferase [Reichenbachiella agariperforans]
MISGGGTGGHIYPAISIANALKEMHPDTEFLFVGAKGKMEMEKVPEAGYKIVGLWISGLQRSLKLSNLMFPFKVASSVLKSYVLLKKFKPDVVVGVGGYASGALLYAASKKGIPTLIQEQNGLAGLTNKLLAKRVDKICVAYEGMERFFPKENIVFTGNPVRNDILNVYEKKAQGLAHFGLSSEKKTLLIIGGSLGARTINNAMAEGVERLLQEGFQVLWQTGKLYYEEMMERTAALASDELKVMPFIKEMDMAYGAADVIISRAGASSISELCLVAKPVIFVPSPNVAEDHQTKNAMAMVSKEAAEHVADDEAPEHLVSEAIMLLTDVNRQDLLKENLRLLAKPHAAQNIANEVIGLIK